MKKGVLHQKDIAEICVHEHKKVEGPTKALVAVVSLAVTLATMGAGAELGALAVSGMGKGIAATTISGMTQGAFTALCSRSAVSLLENRGNVGHVLHDLTSKESLKGFAKDAITTGLIGPGTRVSGIIPTLTQQLVRHAVKSAVGSAFGEKHAFRGFFKDVVVDTVGAVGANMIGDQFHGKKINALSHKLAHAVLGGAMGYVLEGKDGVTPGAVSSVLSETLMEELTPKQAIGQSDEEYLKIIERTSAMVRMITASTALLLRQDIALMDRIGTNAIENNFMRHLDDVVELDEDDPIFQMDKEEALKELQARHEMLGRDGGDIGEFAYEHPEEVLTVGSMVPGLGVVGQVVRGVTRGVKLYRQVKGVVDAVEEVAPVKVVVEDSVPVSSLKSEGIELELQFKEGMSKRDFDRKVQFLQKAAEKGELETTVEQVNRRGTTHQYRKKMETTIERLYQRDDQAKQTILERLQNRTDIDHKIELQLGGKDVPQNLRSLDRTVNRSIGSQIQKQLVKEDGIKITSVKVVEKK